LKTLIGRSDRSSRQIAITRMIFKFHAAALDCQSNSPRQSGIGHREVV